MKSKLINVLLVLILLTGLSLLLYPTVSDAFHSYHQSKLIAQYAQQVNEMEQQAYQQELEAARSYNAELLQRLYPFQLTNELEAQYWNLLSASSIMAYVEIPSIEVTLPIAHGTEEDTLENYVGHVQWSSLPVGGESTHCVISGHRGLPSSELFTNLDHLDLGDVFYIHVLGQTLEYQVDSIHTVLPDEMELLRIEEGQDYVTLLTCTPYGINSHRLLVRGKRVIQDTTVQEAVPVTQNKVYSLDPMVLIPAILAVLSAVIFVIMILKPSKQRAKKKGTDENYA